MKFLVVACSIYLLGLDREQVNQPNIRNEVQNIYVVKTLSLNHYCPTYYLLLITKPNPGKIF